jgi:hypothetical protein
MLKESHEDVLRGITWCYMTWYYTPDANTCSDVRTRRKESKPKISHPWTKTQSTHQVLMVVSTFLPRSGVLASAGRTRTPCQPVCANRHEHTRPEKFSSKRHAIGRQMHGGTPFTTGGLADLDISSFHLLEREASVDVLQAAQRTISSIIGQLPHETDFQVTLAPATSRLVDTEQTLLGPPHGWPAGPP